MACRGLNRPIGTHVRDASATHRRKQRQLVARVQRRLQSVLVVDVSPVVQDVDVVGDVAVFEDPVTKRRVRREQLVEGIADGVAGGHIDVDDAVASDLRDVREQLPLHTSPSRGDE